MWYVLFSTFKRGGEEGRGRKGKAEEEECVEKRYRESGQGRRGREKTEIGGEIKLSRREGNVFMDEEKEKRKVKNEK